MIWRGREVERCGLGSRRTRGNGSLSRLFGSLLSLEHFRGGFFFDSGIHAARRACRIVGLLDSTSREHSSQGGNTKNRRGIGAAQSLRASRPRRRAAIPIKGNAVVVIVVVDVNIAGSLRLRGVWLPLPTISLSPGGWGPPIVWAKGLRLQ